MSLCIPSRHIRQLEARLHPLFTSSLEERYDPWRSRCYVHSECQGTAHLAMQRCISEYGNPNVVVVYKFLLLFIAFYRDNEDHRVDVSKWCLFPVRLYHRCYPSSRTSAQTHAQYSTLRVYCADSEECCHTVWQQSGVHFQTFWLNHACHGLWMGAAGFVWNVGRFLPNFGGPEFFIVVGGWGAVC